jgi:hypothetical protein
VRQRGIENSDAFFSLLFPLPSALSTFRFIYVCVGTGGMACLLVFFGDMAPVKVSLIALTDS